MARRKPPVFDYTLCVACGICVVACSVSALSLTNIDLDKWNKAYPELNGRNCIACGICEKECPVGAIACAPVVEKPAPAASAASAPAAQPATSEQ